MALPRYSLNTLHAFAAAARHLSFTRAAETLCVTQTAVSHQVKLLETQLGRPLFVRTPRGLQLTDEGALLAPPLQAAFAQIEAALAQAEPGRRTEPLTLGVVGTFAHGMLLERLPDFQTRHPGVDLRLQLNNNKVDLLAEGLDAAIRFGDGAWERQQAQALMDAPLAPLCSPAQAALLQQPEDLRRCVLLRSYRSEDWPAWAQAAGLRPLSARGPMFDSSVLMVQAAALGAGVALAPPAMFRRELREGRLVQPFALGVDAGRYWLVRPAGRRPRAALKAFERWLVQALEGLPGAATIAG